MLNAKQATVKYSEGGMGKTTMPLGKMFALAFMAGMFICRSCIIGCCNNSRKCITWKVNSSINIPGMTCNGNIK